MLATYTVWLEYRINPNRNKLTDLFVIVIDISLDMKCNRRVFECDLTFGSNGERYSDLT